MPSEPQATQHLPEDRRPGWLRRWALWWLAVTLLIFGYDIYHDAISEGIDVHLLLEGVMFVAVTTILVVEWRRNTRLSFSLQAANAHRQRLSGEFSDYVRVAFARWSFSKSEQEIAWLLLKGFTFAEIANLRSVQEKTVRQQASAIYAKSGCKNRNEFLAQFIQDLLEGEHLAADGAPEPALSPAPVDASAAAPTSASARAPE